MRAGPEALPRIAVRPARKDECRRIAQFYRLSSDGVADYIWTRMAQPGEDILEVGRRRYEREGTLFSYENCKLLEVDGEVAAMLVAFPMEVDPQHVESDPVLAPFSSLEEDRSWYICGIAVEEACRRQGLATVLLNEAERDARRRGFDKLSLVAFEQNLPAMQLYARHGWHEVRRHPVVPHPLIHYTGDAVLLVKHL